MALNFILVALWLVFSTANANPGYAYTCVGNCNQDVQTKTIGGTILMGGGTDVDDAFRWLNHNSQGGDILVLRASGTGAYNQWIYDFGGVNSVSTIVITEKSASVDPFVLRKISNAEGLWFAGGDQWIYYSWWKDTALQAAVQAQINRNVTVGGTSAGMVVQASYPFTAEFGGADPFKALHDPYNEDVSVGSDFIKNPYLQNTIFDTHFYERDRMGRIVTFTARVTTDKGVTALGIACDESTAILISEDGIGRLVALPGKPGARKCYFLGGSKPEVCRPQTPLEWKGLEILRLQAGDTFDFRTHISSHGSLYTMNVVNGNMTTMGNGGGIY